MERSSLSKGLEVATTVSLIGSQLAASTPQNVSERVAQENTNPTNPPISETTEDSHFRHDLGKASINIPSAYGNESIEAVPYSTLPPKPQDSIEFSNAVFNSSVEEKSFDFTVLDIENWRDYSLESVEQEDSSYNIEVTDDTTMYLIPTGKDNFLKEDANSDLKELSVPAGSNFQIAEIHTIVAPEGNKIKVGSIANNYGSQLEASIIMEATDKDGNNKNFVQKSENVIGTASYIAPESSIYPNKVINTLTALSHISEFQDQNGSFKADQIYSYLDMIGLKDPSVVSQYAFGLTSSKLVVKGGGVCAMATGISELLYSVYGDSLNKVEQWAHPERYSQGPFSPSAYTVDSTVLVASDGNVYDFKWVQNEDKYLKLDVFLNRSGIAFDNTSPDGVGGLSDVDLVINLSLTDEEPVGQTEKIKSILEQYEEFRNTHHESGLQDSTDAFNHGSIGELEYPISLIYNPEELGPFQEYINGNPELQDLMDLKDAVNSYSVDSSIPLSEYLKTTQWYQSHVNDTNKENTDRIIDRVGYTNVPGQPLQCVGFVMLASWLYPDLGIQYVGGSTSKTAKNLIPWELAENQYTGAASTLTGFGGLAYAGKGIDLGFYQPGDLFVIRSFDPGHVGLIVSKMTKENGETVLLVFDSNRLDDGKIRSFVVNEDNIDKIFGPGQKYLIRKTAN